jgi:hypothetical protein
LSVELLYFGHLIAVAIDGLVLLGDGGFFEHVFEFIVFGFVFIALVPIKIIALFERFHFQIKIYFFDIGYLRIGLHELQQFLAVAPL